MPEVASIENYLQPVVGRGHRSQQLPTAIGRAVVYYNDLVIILRQPLHHRPHAADKFLNIALLIVTTADDTDFFHVVRIVGFKEVRSAKSAISLALDLTRRSIQTKR